MTAHHDETDQADRTVDLERTDEGPDLELELGSLYWDTNRWKTYAPYRTEDDLVYMVTVRRKSELADAMAGDSFVKHEDRLADSQFDRMDVIDSYRTRAADEAELLADVLSERTDSV